MILAAFAVFEPLTDCVVRALLSIGMYYFFGVAALFAVAFAIAGSSAREFFSHIGPFGGHGVFLSVSYGRNRVRWALAPA